MAGLVISPYTRHLQEAGPYAQASLLRTAEDLRVLPAVGATASASSMSITSGSPAPACSTQAERLSPLLQRESSVFAVIRGGGSSTSAAP
jgi:hypothetical protein